MANKSKLKGKALYLEAAMEAVATVGIHKTNSYSVTKILGKSQPSFFYHFPTQADLYRDLIEHVKSVNYKLRDSLTPDRDKKTHWIGLQDFIRGNLRWAEKYPAHVDVLFFGAQFVGHESDTRKVVAEAFGVGEQTIYNSIAGGVVEGEFELSLPAKELAFLIHKAALGAVFQIHNERPKKKAKTLEKSVIELARILLKPKTS